MINTIAEFTDKHARAVVVALLGIIAAGSVAGGLWIKNLQSNLEYKDKIIDERMNLIEERHRTRLATVSRRLTLLNNQVEILRKELPAIGVAIKDIQIKLSTIQSNSEAINPIEMSSLNESVIALNKKANALSYALNLSDEMVRFVKEIESNYIMELEGPIMAKEGPDSLPMASRIPFITIIALMVITSLTIVTIWYILIKRKARPIKTSNQANSADTKSRAAD
jgi:hypothetical protein